jgi:hypothetical protein
VDAAALQQFRERVEEYVKLHRSVESKVPPAPKETTPEKIRLHQESLAAALRKARENANRGDLFGSAEDSIRTMITDALKGKQGAASREAVQDGNPAAEQSGTPIFVSINAPYPTKAPMSTVPPTLLLRLPPLPDELNYRFVGRHLILLDTHADLIVDFIVNATP